MNPWMILGLLAGVYGISRIAQSSSAAAAAAGASGTAAQGRIASTDANGMTIVYAIPTGKTHTVKGRSGTMVTMAVYGPTKKFTVPWTAAIVSPQNNVRVYNSNGIGTTVITAKRPAFVYTDGTQKVAISADLVGTALGKAHFTGTAGGSSGNLSTSVSQVIKDAQAL